MNYNIFMSQIEKITIIKGEYKNISLKITENGEIIVKAPKRVSDIEIKTFVDLKKSWVNKQLKKIQEMNLKKINYDFNNYVYMFNKPISFNSKKELFYRDIFNSYLKSMVENMAMEYNIKIKSIKPTNSKRIWGSLDIYNNMRLNWKIIILPKELVKYIIIHELCHSIEFNHSKKFWNLVGKLVPNYKSLKKSLKLYSFILTSNVL